MREVIRRVDGVPPILVHHLARFGFMQPPDVPAALDALRTMPLGLSAS